MIFPHFCTALEEKQYLAAGKMFAHFMVHEGPTPCFFNINLFMGIVHGADAFEISIANIDDYEIRAKLEQVMISHKFVSHKI
jgi:hypothetical protein